jgi:hypothetical protein
MNLKPVQRLLETEMDRKEFLAYLGGLILAVVGISGLIKSITLPQEHSSSKPSTKGGYGSSAYGG